MHDPGAVTQMHVADSQPQHILRTGQAQHAQRDSQVVATHQLPQAQQAQHAKRASHQQTRHRLHMGSAQIPMQGHTGAASFLCNAAHTSQMLPDLPVATLAAKSGPHYTHRATQGCM